MAGLHLELAAAGLYLSALHLSAASLAGSPALPLECALCACRADVLLACAGPL